MVNARRASDLGVDVWGSFGEPLRSEPCDLAWAVQPVAYVLSAGKAGNDSGFLAIARCLDLPIVFGDAFFSERESDFCHPANMGLWDWETSG